MPDRNPTGINEHNEANHAKSSIIIMWLRVIICRTLEEGESVRVLRVTAYLVKDGMHCTLYVHGNVYKCLYINLPPPKMVQI